MAPPQPTAEPRLYLSRTPTAVPLATADPLPTGTLTPTATATATGTPTTTATPLPPSPTLPPPSSTPGQGSTEQSRLATPGGERLVLALFFPWYEADDWASGKMSDRPAVLYDSRHEADLRRQVDQARAAGLDGFISDWFYEGHKTDSSFEKLLTVSAGTGFHSAPLLDFAATDVLHTPQRMVEALRYLMQKYSGHPQFLRIAGRPLLVFWALPRVPPLPGSSPLETWRWIRHQVDPNRTAFWLAEGVDLSYLELFDGIYFFDISWAADPRSANASLRRKWSAFNATHGTAKLLVATAMPGYDDTRLGRPEGRIRERQNGEYYNQSFAAAIEINPSIIVINSFNEWYEGTQIEPSVTYGNLYLDLTGEWVARFKQ